MSTANREGKFLKLETLKLEIYPSREAAGVAAAQAAANALTELRKTRESIGVIFATGSSQVETLRALTKIGQLPWASVSGFHMDDYIGLPLGHRASFSAYLREKLTSLVPMKSFLEIDGNAPDPEKVCRDYAQALRAADPQLCLIGIGENGHLAFNDPEEADFNDPQDVKIVHLDQVCREQQASEGWFQNAAEVPESAITVTMPALFRVPRLIISVSGKRKARVMRRTQQDPISTACPSTILRTHPDATVYLDEDAAAELG
jgi:glucosamine-6-phosphate deaminase